MKYFVTVIIQGAHRKIQLTKPGVVGKYDKEEQVLNHLPVDGHLEIDKGTGKLLYCPKSESGYIDPCEHLSRKRSAVIKGLRTQMSNLQKGEKVSL